jgi:hypothetical protein
MESGLSMQPGWGRFKDKTSWALVIINQVKLTYDLMVVVTRVMIG